MSIIGEALPSEINGQIQIRQEKYGKLNRTTEELQFFNLRSAWVKLVSSVDITDSYEPTSADLKSVINEIKGSQLAKKFVLFNGTADRTYGNTSSQRAGIARNGSILNPNAYGLGGLEFGLKPMPGIINASIKTETRGSLKTGTIKIKAWNRTQFEIIDLLYLRLGYSILLEWGNIMYYKNDGTFVKDNPPSLEAGFLNNQYTTQGILDAIQKNRLSSNGNYDAMYGKVVNFEWSLDEDGSYDITLKIRSIGDVIESLKVNVANDLPTNNAPLSPGGGIYSNPSNKLTEILFSYIHLFNNWGQNLQPGSSTTISANSASPTNPSVLAKMLKSDATLAYNGYGAKIIKGGGLTGIEEEDKLANFLEQSYGSVESSQKMYYVRLGYLLKILETQIFPKYEGKDPILKFNTDVDQNVCFYLDGIVCLNPNLSLIGTHLKYPSGNVYEFAYGAERYLSKIGDVTLGKIMNIYVNISMIAGTMSVMKEPTSDSTLFNDFLDQLIKPISGNLGGYNKFELHIEETTNTTYIIDQYPLPNRDQVLKNLKKVTKDTNAIIELWGYNRTGATSRASFVRNFGMQTSITPELATIITIGAQAQGSAGNTDSTALSKLNQGLRDRIKPTVTDAYVPTAGAETDEDKLKKLKAKFPNVWSQYNLYVEKLGVKNSLSLTTQPTLALSTTPEGEEMTIDFSDQASAVNSIVQYSIAKNAIAENRASGATGFIPVSVNLTLDGISGIKIYSVLSIDTTYLPSNYPKTMDFIVTGVTNNLLNNDWTTEITTIMVPNTSQDSLLNEIEDPKSPPRRSGNSGGGGSGGSDSFPEDQADWPKSSPSGFPMKPTGHQAKEVTKSQIVLHYSAGWQRADKNKQTVDILNSRHQRTAKSPKGIDNPPLGLSYHYGVDVTGHVENFIPENYIAYHASGANQNSIGINIQCIGFGSSETQTNAGPLSKVAGQSPNVKLVDWNGKAKAYRGKEWAQEISDAQYTALLKLIPEIAKRNPSIGSYVWEGEKTFNQIFPGSTSTSYNAGTPGLYSHNSITTGKIDVLPTPKIIELLKNLKF